MTSPAAFLPSVRLPLPPKPSVRNVTVPGSDRLKVKSWRSLSLTKLPVNETEAENRGVANTAAMTAANAVRKIVPIVGASVLIGYTAGTIECPQILLEMPANSLDHNV